MYISYGKLSTEYYNHTKPISSEIMGDISYYSNRLKDVKGSILEAGVGTGRFLIPLLENGLNVDGIDNSIDMLDICKKECLLRNLNPTLLLDDLENIDISEKYEAIIMPTGSFMLIKNGNKVLENFYKALENKGKVIFDISLPSDFTANESKTSTIHTSNHEGILLESKNLEINHIDQYTKTILKYEKYKKGKLIDTELQDFTLYYYGINEMKLILKNIGFNNISISSNYVYNKKPDKYSEIITFEAYK